MLTAFHSANNEEKRTQKEVEPAYDAQYMFQSVFR